MRLPIRMPGRRRLVALASAGALLVSSGVVIAATATPAHAQTACEVTFSANEWGDGNGGFTAQLTIHNLGDPVNGWDLAFTLPGSAQVGQGWNAVWNQSGQSVTAGDMGWNASLGAGGTTELGFNGTGFAGAPTDFSLNGLACDGENGGGQEPDDPSVLATPSALTVEEGDSDTVTITLSDAPGSSVTVTVSATADVTVDPSSFSLTDGNFSSGQAVTVTGVSESTGILTASAPGHDDATVSLTVTGENGGPGPGPGDRVPNPYVGADVYVNPDWSEAAETIGGAPAEVYNQPTGVWLDRIDAIDGGSAGENQTSLEEHLVNAASQASPTNPVVIQVVIYNLPGRDCAALASSGTLQPGELDVYQEDYIDEIVDIMDNPDFSDLRIVNVIEIDSLPNLVTNVSPRDTSTPECDQMLANEEYQDGVAYAVAELGSLPNTYQYVDAAHHGWIGWTNDNPEFDNFNASAEMLASIIGREGATADNVHGFITNTANYSQLTHEFIDPFGTVNGQEIQLSDWVDHNPYNAELPFALAFRDRLVQAGFNPGVGMLIDTSRNGWGGPERPTSASDATDLNQWVNESRIDRRIHKGNWCNQAGAGLGERPTAAPVAGEPNLHAYVWIKPPGESDGSSMEIENDEGKQFDRMCDPTFTEGTPRNGNSPSGALGDAPISGHWFQSQFEELMANAWPPLS